MVKRGAGTASVLLILFMLLCVLKFGEVINWPWWWVIVPLWAPFAFFGMVILVGVFVGFVGAVVDAIFEVLTGKKP